MANNATAAGERRLFVEVASPGPFIDELSSAQGRFVPTRLPVSLGEAFLLAVRLPHITRAIELPVVVLGRRVPRGAHGALSTGVVVRLAEDDHPMAVLLREVASGRVVDLEARVQQHQPRCVTSRFPSRTEALLELASLVRDTAQFPVDDVVSRNDRLALTVEATDSGPLFSVHVLVRSVHLLDRERSFVAVLADAAGQRALEAFLNAEVSGKSTRAVHGR
jgi:Tfp pilus assembly protein PilZ